MLFSVEIFIVAHRNQPASIHIRAWIRFNSIQWYMHSVTTTTIVYAEYVVCTVEKAAAAAVVVAAASYSDSMSQRSVCAYFCMRPSTYRWIPACPYKRHMCVYLFVCLIANALVCYATVFTCVLCLCVWILTLFWLQLCPSRMCLYHFTSNSMWCDWCGIAIVFSFDFFCCSFLFLHSIRF